ncbi:MAG TPA: SIS domain-containing protein [Vicinamibacterales bacterium]|nr:SIS domain-containing protein [Vicinamibacterales bacterium]
MTTTIGSLRALFEATAANLRAVPDEYLEAIHRTIELVTQSLGGGGKLLVFGNGGSSADAQHIAAELVGRFAKERAALPAIALTTNEAILTAWSNDHAFEGVFARQIEALGRKGDIAWGISTSGNSPNVVTALACARARGLLTVGLTGDGGGRLASHCDVLLAAPLSDTPRIQELHVVTYHAICAAVEARLFGRVP